MEIMTFVSVHSNFQVTARFTHFELASADWVRFFDGPVAGPPNMGEFAGMSLPAPSYLTSTGNDLSIKFKSADPQVASGFRIVYGTHSESSINIV